MASTHGNQDIARRYAVAFFALAQETSQIELIEKDMSMLAILCAAGGDFRRFVNDTTLQRADQAKALSVIAKSFKLSDLTEKLLGTLALRRRLPALAAIVAAVQAQIADHKGEATADVVAAQNLDAAQIADIAKHLSKVIGKKVNVQLSVDPAIMGGLVIKVGSKLMDASVKTKLDRLHRALKNSNELNDPKKMKEVA